MTDSQLQDFQLQALEHIIKSIAPSIQTAIQSQTPAYNQVTMDCYNLRNDEGFFHYLEQQLLNLNPKTTFSLSTMSYGEHFISQYFPADKPGGFGRSLFFLCSDTAATDPMSSSDPSSSSNPSSYSDPSSSSNPPELALVFFGEICGTNQGTLLSAKGNHFAGRNPKPITDDTVVKDIIHLRPLNGASDFVNQAFSNQVATLEEILIQDADNHALRHNTGSPIVTEFLASSEPSTNDHSFIKITMPAKYRIPPGTKTGKTEPKQRKNLLPVKQEGSDGRDTFSPTPAQTLPEVKRNTFYPLDMLPDHRGNYFQQTHAKLVQHDVFDADENLIPPWLFYDKLRPGTIIVVEATLICWHINSTGKEGDKDKKIYQIQGHRTRVLSDSDEDIEIRPIPQLTAPISTMPTTTSPRKEASTAFSSFESPTKRARHQ